MRRGQAYVTLEWRVPPGQTQPITAALQAVMLATRQEVGCLGCFVSTAAADHITVRYAEDWDTEAHLRNQLKSERFRVIARLVESAIETPRIGFELPDGTRGFDYAIEVCEAS